MKGQLLVIFSAAAALNLAGCTQAPDQAQVQKDVEKAQAEGQKKVADARANLEKVVAENRKDVVETRVDNSSLAVLSRNRRLGNNGVRLSKCVLSFAFSGSS